MSLKEGPHVKAVIRNAAENSAAPIWVACVICSFQFSFKSTQTPRILRTASGFASQPWIFTVENRIVYIFFE